MFSIVFFFFLYSEKEVPVHVVVCVGDENSELIERPYSNWREERPGNKAVV